MIALASDFDGTIFFSKDNVPDSVPLKPENTVAIKEFHEKGNLFGFCTGRIPDDMIKDTAKVVDADFYIMVSGSLILDKQMNIIFDSPIDREALQGICDEFSKYSDPAVLTKDDMYIIGDLRPYGIHIKSLSEVEGKVYGVSLALKDEAESHRVADEIKAKYGDKVEAYPNNEYLDMVAKGCSKGTGIEFVKAHYGIDKMCGIGDSFNDLPMLRQADTSFTFDYSAEKVQAEADYVVNTVADAVKILLK